MQGYTFDLDLEQLGYLGVPTDKIVLGLTVLVIVAHFVIIGAGHHDASNEYTSIEDTVAMARERGLGGVMTWNINRDCRWGTGGAAARRLGTRTTRQRSRWG